MNNKLKRGIATVSLFVALVSGYLITEPHYDAKYELLDNDPAFAKCSCGTVYIGDKYFLNSIPLEDNIILVEDQRHSSDPNMKIYASCSICSREDRNDILEILQEYERRDPSEWDRSIESMRLEWLMHNISYNFDVQRRRTEDVDLDNLDEEKYQQKILQLLFRV